MIKWKLWSFIKGLNINALICKIRGHNWKDIHEDGKDIGFWDEEGVYCIRCGKEMTTKIYV